MHLKAISNFTLKEYFSMEISHLLISPKPGDQYLASFPRSGNTWIRNMLGVLVDPSQEGNPDFTRQQFPGISLSNIYKIRHLDPPRIIKTHTWYRKSVSRAVYLVRDGRDVLVSVYHYNITRKKKDIPFSDFFYEYLAGRYGQSWSNNVASWLIDGKKDMGDELLIIHFDELKRDTSLILKKIARFFDIPFNDGLIDKAVKLASIERMRKIEAQRRGSIVNQNASFYRGGKTGEWIDYFTPEMEKAFYDEEGEMLKFAGYL